MDRPRRIFRSSNRSAAAHSLLRTSLLALAGIGTLAVLLTVGLSSTLFGQMTAEPRVIAATADRVAVIDGDTLRLDGMVVRLIDLKAPARGQSCAAAPDCGTQATAELARLVRDRRVECRVYGHDALGRPAARCEAGGHDVNLALVSTGWARSDGPALDAAQSDARSHGRGIWLDR